VKECIGGFDVTVVHYLFPLGIGFIGKRVMGTPAGVSALHKPKYGMAIDVVGVECIIFQDNCNYTTLEGLVGPRSTFF